MIELGERIKEKRISLELSQKQLSELIGVHQTSISQYESGEKTPSIEVLIKLVKALDTTADYLLCLTEFD